MLFHGLVEDGALTISGNGQAGQGADRGNNVHCSDAAGDSLVLLHAGSHHGEEGLDRGALVAVRGQGRAVHAGPFGVEDKVDVADSVAVQAEDFHFLAVEGEADRTSAMLVPVVHQLVNDFADKGVVFGRVDNAVGVAALEVEVDIAGTLADGARPGPVDDRGAGGAVNGEIAHVLEDLAADGPGVAHERSLAAGLLAHAAVVGSQHDDGIAVVEGHHLADQMVRDFVVLADDVEIVGSLVAGVLLKDEVLVVVVAAVESVAVHVEDIPRLVLRQIQDGVLDPLVHFGLGLEHDIVKAAVGHVHHRADIFQKLLADGGGMEVLGVGRVENVAAVQLEGAAVFGELEELDLVVDGGHMAVEEEAVLYPGAVFVETDGAHGGRILSGLIQLEGVEDAVMGNKSADAENAPFLHVELGLPHAVRIFGNGGLMIVNLELDCAGVDALVVADHELFGLLFLVVADIEVQILDVVLDNAGGAGVVLLVIGGGGVLEGGIAVVEALALAVGLGIGVDAGAVDGDDVLAGRRPGGGVVEDNGLLAGLDGGIPDEFGPAEPGVEAHVQMGQAVAGGVVPVAGDAVRAGIGAGGQGGPVRRGDGGLHAQHAEVFVGHAAGQELSDVGQIPFVQEAGHEQGVGAVETEEENTLVFHDMLLSRGWKCV